MFISGMINDLARIRLLAGKEISEAGHPEEFTAITGMAYCIGALKGMQIYLKLSHKERLAETKDLECFLKDCMKNLREMNDENK